MMKGYKTWIAVLGMAALGVADILNGHVEQAIVKFTGALGMLGIGHKIEKHSAKGR